MWVNYIKNTKFLMQLFNNVPELKDVEIEQFNMNYYWRKINIIIKLPQLIDEIPLKWKQNNFNAALIEMDFWDVTQFVMSMDNNKKSKININKYDDIILVEIQGGINAKFSSVGGYIQNVSGYCLW